MRLLLLTAVLIVAGAGPASAQTDAALFVSGGIFAGIERVSHTEVEAPFFDSGDVSGTVIGGAAGIGTFVHPAWSVRLEVAVPGKLEDEINAFDLGGGISVGPTSTHTLRTYTGTVLVGHHLIVSSRFSVGLLGGVVIGRRQTRTVVDLSIVLPPGIPDLPLPLPLPPLQRETETTSYHAGAGLGIDFDWALTDRFVVSPQVRAHVLSGALSLRPGVGVRFNFR